EGRYSGAGAILPERVLPHLSAPPQGDDRRSHGCPAAVFVAGECPRVAQRDRAHRHHESDDRAARPEASAVADLPRWWTASLGRILIPARGTGSLRTRLHSQEAG